MASVSTENYLFLIVRSVGSSWSGFEFQSSDPSPWALTDHDVLSQSMKYTLHVAQGQCVLCM